MTSQPPKTSFDDHLLSLSLARVSEAAALAAAKSIGRGNEQAADQAAVAAMHQQLNLLDMSGVVVIGEGTADEAPKLFVGEQLGTGTGIGTGIGTGTGPQVDIALDPLEGTTLTAKDMANALTVVAMGPSGSMLRTPDVYMDKLAVGPGYDADVVTLDMAPDERVRALAVAKGCDPADIAVCILERPRHEAMIAQVRATGALIRLINDGDIAGVMHCADTGTTGIDMYMGSGGAPEGVLAAAALKCMGGQMWGRLLLRNADERACVARAGITDPDRVYARDDMVTGDVVFAATGVTSGSLLSGVRREGDWITTETLLMRSKTGSMRRICYRSKVAKA